MAQQHQEWGNSPAPHRSEPAPPLAPARAPKSGRRQLGSDVLLVVAGCMTALLMTGAFFLVDGVVKMMGPDRQAVVDEAQLLVDDWNLSQSKLVEELKKDGHSHADAEFAAKEVRADWNLEASGAAEDALNYSAFSEQGLIEFLEFGGFTQEQAEFAVGQQTVDWHKQAAILASSYLDVGIDTKRAMIDQLLYEGFSRDEAEFGAAAVGLR